MTSYSLVFKAAVEKDLRSLPRTTLLRVFKRIIALQTDPFPQQSKKLSGTTAMYRIRVGDYRIIYEIEGGIIIVHYVRHRRDVYRR